jgi:hypothetical protein
MFLPLVTFLIFVLSTASSAVATDVSVPSTKQVLASSGVIPGQYHYGGGAVSRRLPLAVSRSISAPIGNSAPRLDGDDYQLYTTVDSPVGLGVQIAASQYQRDSDQPKRRLMLLVGLGLGAAYVLFLAAWIWATRLRSRPPRH